MQHTHGPMNVKQSHALRRCNLHIKQIPLTKSTESSQFLGKTNKLENYEKKGEELSRLKKKYEVKQRMRRRDESGSVLEK